MLYKLHGTSDLNMMIAQDEKERIEILVRKIQDKWNDKNQKFVNLHKIIFDPQTLIFVYSDVAQSKGANATNLDGINLAKMNNTSKHFLNRSWVASLARRVLIPKKKLVQLDH